MKFLPKIIPLNRNSYHLKAISIDKKNLITFLLLTTFIAFLSGSAKAEKPHVSNAFLRINQYFVLFTSPISPYIDSGGNFIVGLTGLNYLLTRPDPGGSSPQSSPVNTLKIDLHSHVATIIFGSQNVVFTDGSRSALVDGKPVPLPSPSVMEAKSHEFCVPISVLLHAFHISYVWNPKTRILFLQSKTLAKDVDAQFAMEAFKLSTSSSSDVFPLKCRVYDFEKVIHSPKIKGVIDRAIKVDILVRDLIPDAYSTMSPPIELLSSDADDTYIVTHPNPILSQKRPKLLINRKREILLKLKFQGDTLSASQYIVAWFPYFFLNFWNEGTSYNGSVRFCVGYSHSAHYAWLLLRIGTC